ncbi:chemotaxis protein methyltransferase CheR [Alkalispirochaeta americana]|uniref:protein-glutamate O-methyltransferase n=1 Tax=Alkalispirochaeta americana TaxID=159291 RepID=A0A1N6U2E3_9SPIO|nr:protein-glutamate O-methyltransferase CheR [Alkalispirochaeta americana]SIQ59818.1 chemotaxis protein methyltransferase CheR [Alkalispirochaeta americana]
MSEFLSDADFTRFRDLIYNESGIHFSESNRTILESRLKERLKAEKIETVGQYFSHVRSDQEELKVLLDAVTTNLTRFFRNAAHWQTFENYVLPDLVKYKREKGDRKFRVWSAGCSTGEEPYTIAMQLLDLLPPGFDIEILASDLSLKSVLTGQQGFYPDSRVTGIPEKPLAKYFDKKDGGYQVKDSIKKLVTFDYHNLKHDSGKRNLDVVFCRNVLIYFDEPAQKVVVDRFWNAMANHSFLFIGHSESLFGMKTQFSFLKTDWACIYAKDV